MRSTWLCFKDTCWLEAVSKVAIWKTTSNFPVGKTTAIFLKSVLRSVRLYLLMLESNIFKQIQFWKMTSTFSGWKTTSSFFQSVLRSVRLYINVRKQYFLVKQTNFRRWPQNLRVGRRPQILLHSFEVSLSSPTNVRKQVISNSCFSLLFRGVGVGWGGWRNWQ